MKTDSREWHGAHNFFDIAQPLFIHRQTARMTSGIHAP
jgi:hypothetical protein